MSLKVIPLPALKDNYIHFLLDESNGQTAVVDPGEAKPVLDYLKHNSLKLNFILVTHHHWDHTDGITELKRQSGCQVIGAKQDCYRLPSIDIGVVENEDILLGEARATVLEIPGHTVGHVAYWFPGLEYLFTGDTLFNFGCGRLFEGTADEMWRSLSKLMTMPDDAWVYCGHEYTVHNLEFALSLEPHNDELKVEIDRARRDTSQNIPTVPCRLGDQKRLNPFLRIADPRFRGSVGLNSANLTSAFAMLRKRKDEW